MTHLMAMDAEGWVLRKQTNGNWARLYGPLDDHPLQIPPGAVITAEEIPSWAVDAYLAYVLDLRPMFEAGRPERFPDFDPGGKR